MFMKKLLTGTFAGLLLCVQSAVCLAAVPVDAPKDVKHILGFYYGNGENILIREKNGALELLYRSLLEDKSFALANVFPLKKNHFDAYTMLEAGPMSSSEANVRFERDADGYGISCRVGGHTYTRRFFGSGTGERDLPFRFPAHSAEEWTALREQAAAATMPSALAEGEVASLVDVASVEGVRVDSRYATEANCFGAPLYTTAGLQLASEAVEALGKVQQHLKAYGYGLVVWDAYRPWSVSKLAHLALPAKQKDMLENPDTKGSTHNTGMAVDVTLYSLATGEEVELACGFDEPSLRQYSSYPGGTSRQRYLQTLLRESMELYGFKGIEMEWWHFEYAADKKWAHLNQ